MLLTRCPDCDTTFRVTDDALKKANGQVRCGRCASVFNAYAELQHPDADPDSDVETRTDGERRADDTPPADDTQTAGDAPHEEPTPSEPAAATTTHAPAQSAAQPAAAPHAPHASAAPERPGPPKSAPRRTDPLGALVADVVAQVERGGAPDNDENADTGEMEAGAWSEPAPISAEQVDAVLEIKEPPAPVTPPAWALPAGQQRRSRWWGTAAGVAVLVLGVQLLHHFRADLVGHAFVGPVVQEAYGMLGATVTPHWNVRQYEVLDWVANAEPNARGQGNLRITARIQNTGPQRQPYPLVHLRLKDRFEAAVGSRMFAPAQYLDSTLPVGRLMTPGETTRAQLDVVDPGPDAYGFDLDVCIEVEAGVLSCRTDKVFQ